MVLKKVTGVSQESNLRNGVNGTIEAVTFHENNFCLVLNILGDNTGSHAVDARSHKSENGFSHLST